MAQKKGILPRNLREMELCLRSALDCLTKGKLPKLAFWCEGALRDRAWIQDRVKAELATVQAVKDARSEWLNLRRKRDAGKGGRKELVQALLLGVQNQAGPASGELKNWGFRPEKKPKRATAEELLNRTQKARITRASHARPKKK